MNLKKHSQRDFITFFDSLLYKIPILGKILTTLFGAQENLMLELFRKIDEKFNTHMLFAFSKYIFKGRWGGKVIPLNINFHPDTRFLPTEEILSLLSRSKVTGISNCYCRETQIKHGENPNIKYPVRTCIHIGLGKDLREIPFKSENLRKVPKEEIVKILRRAEKAGLIHQLIYFPNPQFYYVVCNCDPLYCIVLNGFIKKGSPQMIKSDFIALTDERICNNCGVCEEWCYFGARKALHFYQESCFGCGICVSKCPNNAIKLIKKS